MKIAVLGSHPETKMKAPFDDPEWKIWACSPHNFEKERLPRVDEWFESHIPAGDKERICSLEQYVRSVAPTGEPGRIVPTKDKGPVVVLPPTRSPAYLAFVNELSGQIPVWMRDRTNHPKALQYPEAELKREFSPFHFTSSIAFIMAKAIAAKPEAIGLWGILQASENEWAYQRPGTQYFIWEAHKRGIQVVLPEEARDLLAPPPENF